MTSLAATNNLVLSADNVWHVPAPTENFGYSDGSEVETYLKKCFEECSDLSSTSIQLEDRIVDWPTEYHLSPMRANLLRAFDLTRTDKVLELGAGCGTITRYLGEAGLQVDAIEGSAARAALARQRCHELDNVSIVNCNFNDLELPENYYDGIFAIGVMEYAKYFRSGDASHRETVKVILNNLLSSLSQEGCIVIAIENRLGLKYLFGAGEDHYGSAYTGVYGYRVDDSIRTYSRNEWLGIFSELGIESHSFLFPFPDYKVPSVILCDEYLNGNPHAATQFSRIASRDYANLLAHDNPEKTFWEGLQQENIAGSLSNSFLIVLARSDDAIKQFAANDFVHCSNLARKPVYRTVSRKPAEKNIVFKHKIYPEITPASGDSRLVHRPTEETFVSGETLADQWCKILLCGGSFSDLVKSLHTYFDYLLQCRSEYKESGGLVDLLPFNIIVHPDGRYQAIDHEWVWKDGEVEPDFVLFRALLYFAINDRSALRHVLATEEIINIRQFVKKSFTCLGLDLERHLDTYIEMENYIQQVTRNKDHAFEIREELEKAFGLYEFEPKLIWTAPDQSQGELKCRAYLGQNDQRVKFELPTGLPRIHSLRFSPSVSGFLHLHEFAVYAVGDDNEEVTITSILGAEIAQRAMLEHIDAEQDEDGAAVFFFKQDDAGIELDLSGLDFPENSTRLHVIVTLDWPVSKDFGLFRDAYVNKNTALELDLVSHRQQIVELRAEKFELVQANHTIQKELKAAKQELRLIKSSRVWETAEKGRRLLYGGLLKKPLNGTTPNSRIADANDVNHRVSKKFPDELFVADSASPGSNPATDRSQPARQNPFEINPKISIVMPVFNTDSLWLEAAISSIKYQSYGNWEVCIVDDCSSNTDTRTGLSKINDPRVKLQTLPENRGISRATNAGLRMASGEYIAFMDHDDELTPDALYEVVKSINEHDPDIVYSDEDLIDPRGEYSRPHYKPDYSPDLLLSHNYITHLLVVRKALVEEVGKLNSAFDGAQDYDFVLRACEKTNRIHHIPKVLYHWRQTQQSTSMVADAKPEANDRALDVVRAALTRRGVKGVVSHANMPYFYRIDRKIHNEPLVGIVIPFMDRADLLDLCISRILEVSTYNNYEIIGVSNNSELDETHRAMRDYELMDNRVKFYEFNNPFNFSRIVNYGVSKSNGEHVVLVNNDIRVITWSWIEALLQHSQRDEVGAVGGKLYYPDNTVQHAGIVVGIDGYAGHGHKRAPARANGYFNRLQVTHNVSAVTGAFMMVKKSLFENVGGFDEDHFQIACNDVDFCLRLRALGYYNIFTPYAEAYHDESASRGYETTDDKKARFDAEKALFSQRYAELFEHGDPFYNPNLTHTAEDFSARA